MIMQETTPEMVEKWKSIFSEYKTKLYPNKKPTLDIIKYIKHKYPLIELADKKWSQIVVDNLLQNECYAEKLPVGKMPVAIVYSVKNSGTGKILYEKQDDIFNGINIVFGVELETAFFTVEGSSLLWDELFAFRGLDEVDLNNYYLVAEYITCLKKFNMLDSVLTQTKNI